MTRDASEIISSLRGATEAQFRGRLLARGQAQSMIRRDGVLPPDAPLFSDYLDADLLNYSYALISSSLQLLDMTDSDGDAVAAEEQATRQQWARTGFQQASYALEAATRNADREASITFHRLIAGAASHLAGYSARAYSLVQSSIASGRLAPMEATLADIMLRRLDGVEARTIALRSSPQLTDDALYNALQGRTSRAGDAGGAADSAPDDQDLLSILGPVGLLLTEQYHSAVTTALFALAYNRQDLLQTAIADLGVGEQAALDASLPGPWWVYRLTRRLLGDLGQSSIAVNLPLDRPPAATADKRETQAPERNWSYLRRTFIATLLARSRSEIDLWPSQMHIVERIFGDTADLVVALPTSAGKTRIAELCILACLAQGRRIVYITPLRALSAQTEQTLQATFAPLGSSVSSLYGSMGTTDLDQDALWSSHIVVATPEKLDFALRSDPTVLDDVGLVVLDEGHMIGPEDREVRYEAQVQRLLRRADASTRRIVCLSAVFPPGQELDDFVAWVTDDDVDGLHHEDWRPTLQRFGLVEWREDHARLAITVGGDPAFIPRYIEAIPPKGRRKKAFPADDGELVVATTWRLVEEGQSVLIFCPQRRSVEPYAKRILKLRQQGFIESLLPSGVELDEALAIGAEWFGADHPILECLKLGVAIHHGALPGPFRREVERLLRSGQLKVTVASPTLAQGLNLSASAVLFHGLTRVRDLLSGAEFANVIGRAGRAFVDTEGLVLYPRFTPTARSRRDWLTLTSGAAGKPLQSGLIAVSVALVKRLLDSYGSQQLQLAIDYLTGAPDWALPVIRTETSTDHETAAQQWSANLARLDTALLSILGDDDSGPEAVTQLIADVLRDSLWERQIRRFDTQPAAVLREVVSARARHLWSISTAAQRRGWYLAGVGAEAGSELAGIAEGVVDLTSQAEIAIELGETRDAAEYILQIAEVVFGVSQFAPETSLLWPPVLAHWLSGRALHELGEDPVEVAQFIESDLTYRLVWGMEACRVYALAQGNLQADSLIGTAAMAIEAGTLSRPAAVLIRSGFDHRVAAIRAVDATAATFESAAEMRAWVEGLDPQITTSSDWPTVETHAAWQAFARGTAEVSSRRWVRQVEQLDAVRWNGAVPPPGAWLRATRAGPHTVALWSPGFDRLGEARFDINTDLRGILHARRLTEAPGVILRYRGPRDLLPRADARPGVLNDSEPQA